MREVLTSNRTYYVRTDGSDSNGGLGDSPSGSFLTVGRAITEVCTAIDPTIHRVVIQLGTGVFIGDVVLRPHYSIYDVIISGSSTPGATALKGTTNHTVTCYTTTRWELKNVELRNDVGSSYGCLYTATDGGVTLSNVQFSSSLSNHIIAYYGSTVWFNGSYRITGNCPGAHVFAVYGSTVYMNNAVCDLIGSRTIGRFIQAGNNASIVATNFTYTGTMTGTRWDISNNSTCYVNGTAPSMTYFPGNLAGVTSSGGVIT